MRHLAGWSESIDQAALARITVVQDDVLTPSDADRFLVPSQLPFLRHAWATGLNLSRARLVSPSLDVSKSDLDLVPRGDGSDLLALTAPQIWIPRQPIPLDASEALEAQTAEDGAGATRQTVIVSLGTEQDEPMAQGRIRAVRATGTATLTAFEWSAVTLTLESSLEAGMYQLVHFIPLGVSVIAARWLPQGGGFRPGTFGRAGASPDHFSFDPTIGDQLGWYNILTFSHITVPQIQYLAGAADTAQVVILYVIRTGPAPGG